MTKEEFLQYQADQRKQKALERIYKVAGYGSCTPLTDNEWESIETKGKSRFKNSLTKQSSFKK